MTGALVAVRENGAASGPGVLALYVYDNLGRRASLTRGNGVVTTYAYDSASRLDVLTHNLSGTGSDVTLDFAHNAAGQIFSRDRTNANGSYVYPQPGMNPSTSASKERPLMWSACPLARALRSPFQIPGLTRARTSMRAYTALFPDVLEGWWERVPLLGSVEEASRT